MLFRQAVVVLTIALVQQRARIYDLAKADPLRPGVTSYRDGPPPGARAVRESHPGTLASP